MRTTLLFLVYLLILDANAQENRFSIRVKDSLSGEPVSHAVISVLKVRDSSVVIKKIADQNGFCVLSLSLSETFVLRVEARSYQKTYVSLSETDSFSILMRAAVKEFRAASVTAKSQFITQGIDQTVLNPDALPTAAGLSAADILERAPGIMIDQQGGIRLQGMAGVSVYINEQLLILGEEELIQYLRSIPAETVQSLIIMTNPSSKYPAAGNGGVVVIRLRKSRTKGFNGRYGSSAGTGRYLRHNQSLSFNYRVNKVNFFGNLSFGWNNNFQDLTIRRNYYDQSSKLTSSFVQNTYIRKENTQYQGNIGADFYLSDQQTLTVSVNGMNLLAARHTANYAEIRNAGHFLMNQVRADIPIETRFKNSGINAYYDLRLDSGRAGLSFYTEYSEYASRNRQSTYNRLYDSIGSPISETMLIGDLPSNIRLLTSGTDYHKEFGKYGRMEAGLRSSWIGAGNKAGFFDEVNGLRSVNNDYSNNFDYRENIQAAYWNHSLRKNRFSVQAGLRYEYTSSAGLQSGNAKSRDSSFSRYYHSLFPTVYLSYALDSQSQHILGLNFGRRVDRPNYQDMNPFIYPLDRYTLYAGNPFIRPTFSNELEFTYLYKSNWRANLVGGLTNNLISETIEQINGIFYSRPGNIGQQKNLGVNVSGNSKIAKWLRMNLYAELTHSRFSGTLYGQELKNSGTYCYLAPNFQFTLHKKWNAELSGTYQSKVVSAQFVLIPVGSARAGVAWQFNKQGTLRFAVTDFMYTMKPGGNILSLNQSTASWKSFLDTRVATLSFSYQFNRGESLNRLKDEQQGAEKQRVRVG